MPMTFDDLVVHGARWALAAAAAWLLLVLLAALVETACRHRLPLLAYVGCPDAWRPVVLLVAAAALSAPLAPASAAARDGEGREQAWLALPTRPVDPVRPPAEHRVVAGDTLWGIARSRLPAGVRDGAVVREVDRIHRGNAAVIGEDPDLIVPGQRLVLPARHRGVTS